MRLIGVLSTVFMLALSFVMSEPITTAGFAEMRSDDDGDHRRRTGRAIFRFDTFGDEQFWTDVLRMHEAIATVSPTTALSVGLKVDVEALPRRTLAALKAGLVDLDDPAVTIELLRLDAVVGVRGKVNKSGELTSLGITCALCHSTVDNSFTAGIGRRLDGWANTDLNVGAIVALSPTLDPALKEEFSKWGPGKYDPRHHAFDGTNLIPLNSPSLPIVIPPIYGLKGVGFETFTGDGPISYWNAYVGVGQMGGQGRFSDPRINLTIRQTPDLVTPKLAALLDYQLSLDTPRPPKHSFNRLAAFRGARVFRNEGDCARCHRGAHLHRRPTRPEPECAVPARADRGGYRAASMRPEARLESTGRRRFARSGSIHRTSTTAAPPIFRPSSNTTTPGSASTSRRGRKRISSSSSSRSERVRDRYFDLSSSGNVASRCRIFGRSLTTT